MSVCPKCGQWHGGDRCEAPLPRRLDRYDLLAWLGSGGFGSVYRAKHVHTGQDLAVKVVRRDRDPQAVERLLREARATAALTHPNVVRVLDCGTTDEGDAFVAMELVAGCELRELLRGGPLPVARAAGIAVQMLDALAAAHARGIVHRDVKPANVFVTTARDAAGDERDSVKLLDFGVSKIPADLAAPLTAAGVVIGTPGYMAPEQLRDTSGVDARADVYAVGVTLYEMLAGRPPLLAANLDELATRMWSERPPPLGSIAPHVPAALADAVDRALARDADARWPRATDFAAAIRRAVGGADAPSTITTVPPTAHTTGARPAPPAATPRTGAALLIPLVSLFAAVAALLVAWLAVVRADRAPAPAAVSQSAAAQAGTAPVNPSAPADPSSSPGAEASQTPVSTGSVASSLSPSPSSNSSRVAFGFASAPGVVVQSPLVVGSVGIASMRALAKRTVAQMRSCVAPGGRVTVRVQLFVQPSGEISIAQPEPFKNTDERAARCVADAFREGAPVEPGQGVVTFEVDLGGGPAQETGR
jgi:serine/threonine protein kinase